MAIKDDFGNIVSTSAIDKKFWDYFDVPSTGSDQLITTLNTDTLPRDQGAVLATYAILLAIGGIGNVGVLVALSKSRRRKSRVDLLMTHLAIADVCVTCGVIPLEIGWKYTNAWLVGNLMCKLLQVLRAFGLYLSSNVLVCISLDRFFAVLHPLQLSIARRRSKHMLYCAWAAAIACSLPQSVVFRVLPHPRVAGFEQCVSFEAFSALEHEVAYTVFCVCAMYFIPLVIITVCYVCIFCEIRQTSKELDAKCGYRKGMSQARLRRSDRRVMERAKRRTLRMTVTIVSVFALCWLPYATMAMWYMVDRESAKQVSNRVQDLLFAMAVSNSCMNPLVYGTYTLDLKGAIRRFFKRCCRSPNAAEPMGTSRSTTMKNRNTNLEAPLVTQMKKTRNRRQLGVRFAETSLTAIPVRVEVMKPRGPA